MGSLAGVGYDIPYPFLLDLGIPFSFVLDVLLIIPGSFFHN